jgi:PST family polysaccharide transporter
MDERAIRGVPWTLLSYVGSKTITVGSTLVLAHLLVPKDFGLIALASMVTSFLSWFGDLGFARTLVLRQDLDRRGQGTLLTLVVTSSLAAMLLAVGVSPLVALAFGEPRLTALLSALSGVLAFGGVALFYEALLERELQFRRRFVGYGVQAATSAVVSISLAAAGAGVWSLVAGQVAGFAMFALTLAGLAPHRVRPRFERDLVSDLFRTSRGFLGQGIANFIRSNTDYVVVARTFGAGQLGYYSMAYRLCDLSWTGIAAPTARVTFAAFARARHRGEDIRPAFMSVLQMVALVGCPFGVLLSSASEPITRVLLGEKWLPMIGPLSVLGIWAAIRPMESALNWLLNAAGRAGASGWASAVVLVPLVPALVVAVHLGGLSAVALVVTADAVLSLGVLGFLARRYVQVSILEMWKAVRAVVIASVPMWLTTWEVGRAVGDRRALIGLPAAVIAGLCVYAGAISVLDRRLLSLAGSHARRAVGRAPAATPS